MTVRMLKWEPSDDGTTVTVWYDAGTGDQPQVTMPSKVFYAEDTSARDRMLEFAANNHRSTVDIVRSDAQSGGAASYE